MMPFTIGLDILQVKKFFFPHSNTRIKTHSYDSFDFSSRKNIEFA